MIHLNVADFQVGSCIFVLPWYKSLSPIAIRLSFFPTLTSLPSCSISSYYLFSSFRSVTAVVLMILLVSSFFNAFRERRLFWLFWRIKVGLMSLPLPTLILSNNRTMFIIELAPLDIIFWWIDLCFASK